MGSLRGFSTDDDARRDVTSIDGGPGTDSAVSDDDTVDEGQTEAASVPGDSDGTRGKKKAGFRLFRKKDKQADGDDAGPDASEDEPDADGESVPDYGPGRDTVYRRDTWPAYAYPPRKKFRIPPVAIAAFIGMFLGFVVFQGAWAVVEAYQQHAMYSTEQSLIESRFVRQPITIRAAYAADMKSSAYYGTEAWMKMNPVENEDGSITFSPDYKEDFYEFVMSLRAEIDRLLDLYGNDESFLGFSAGEPGMDYYSVNVETIMRQASLIDQSKSQALIRQMKIQSFFYSAVDGVEATVSILFVNDQTGETVLTMNM